MSSSMASLEENISRWESARRAVGKSFCNSHLFNSAEHIAPYVCQADPDGITIYFFSGAPPFPKMTNVRGNNFCHSFAQFSRCQPDCPSFH